MPDLVDALLPKLETHRLPSFALGDGFIYPQYEGGAILNLPSTVCRLLGAPGLGAGPLADEILAPLASAGPYRKIILILMDALALHRFRAWMEDGSAPVWKELLKDGLLAPLTSIVPSTTASALTSLWTGRSTAEHAIAGYEVWLKEYGVVANMLKHSPISFDRKGGASNLLNLGGFDPQSFLGLPTLGTHLAAQGVQVRSFQHYTIANSGLSAMLQKDVQVRSFSTAADLWINLRQAVESSPQERQYNWVYWGEVDHQSHVYGPDDEHPAAEFALFSKAFQQFFLERLSPGLRKDTLVILTADHGAVSTPKYPHYELRQHPGLVRRLHMYPSGEARLAYLYLRPGQGEAAREYIERAWPNQFSLFDPVYAVESGLFGPGTPHPALFDRLGDLVAAARGPAYFWWDLKENPLLGRHGGLTPEEMLVPFLAARLG